MSGTSDFDSGAFFDSIRGPLFNGHLDETQVAGLTAILGAWSSAYANDDERWLAYALATAYHETARTMQPIREWGLGRGRAYGATDPVTGQVYYGRGLVQLTWKSNYAKMGAKLGIDLVKDPDLALVSASAAAIMLLGMTEGSFTGVGLGRYFSETENDPVNARRIINGTDCAAQIAVYYGHFLTALDDAVQALSASEQEPTS